MSDRRMKKGKRERERKHCLMERCGLISKPALTAVNVLRLRWSGIQSVVGAPSCSSSVGGG